MALTYEFCTVLHDDCDVYTLQNNSDYTTGGEVRVDTGDKLIAAHVDSDEVENFVEVDSTPYLTKIAYEIYNDIDGHYRHELLRFPLFSTANPYIPEVRDVNEIITTYANLVYLDSEQKFYKCILANPATSVSPSAPTGSTYWEEITDFTDAEVRMNTTIKVGVFNDLADCRSKKCVKNELYKQAAKDPACLDQKTLLLYFKKSIYLAGARAKNSDNKPEEAERIIRILSNLCNEC